MILESIIPFLHGWKLAFLGVFTLGGALLAAGEINGNRTLIVVALITMAGTMFTGVATLVSARISASNARHLEVVAQLPTKVEEYTKNVDGKMSELMELTREAERAKGKEEERLEEIGRRGSAALAQQTIPATPVVVENTKDNPANVKQNQ